MNGAVGIVGGASLIEGANIELSVEETVFLTVRNALESSGLSRDQIDTVVQCADDVLDGISINHVYQVEAAGSPWLGDLGMLPCLLSSGCVS